MPPSAGPALLPGPSSIVAPLDLAVYDARLEVFGREISDVRTKLVSFDCFDTLIWRRVPKPTDMFWLLGQRLADLGLLARGATPELFGHLRMAAEAKARRDKAAQHGTAEVTIADIYAKVPAHLFRDGVPTVALDHELALEREFTVPNMRLAQALHATCAARPELRLVVVSDTYLSREQLVCLLDKGVFAGLPWYAIYVSSEEGVSKATELWARLPARLGCRPDEIVHLGDNYAADVAAARATGVRAVHFPSREAWLDQQLWAERWLRPGPPASVVDHHVGDSGFTSLRSHAAFRPEGAKLPRDYAIYWRTGTTVLGPVLTSWADWVHRRADEEGIETALCLMREGKLLRELLDGSGPSARSLKKTALLWVSREACARAAVLTGSRAELQAFLTRRTTPPSPGQLLETFGIDKTTSPELARFAAAHPASDLAASHAVVEHILGSPELVAAVVSHSRQLRAHLIDHLVKQAGTDHGTLAVVDVGFGGQIQALLQAIVDASGLDMRFVGFYLLSFFNSEPHLLAGNHIESYLANLATPADLVGDVFQNTSLLELMLGASEGSVTEIGPGGTPRCAQNLTPAAQEIQREVVQLGIKGFQRERALHEAFLPAGTDSLRPEDLLRLLARFLARPTAEEVQAFGGWQQEDSLDPRDALPLVQPRVAKLARYLPPIAIAALPPQATFWKGGTAVTAGPGTADVVAMAHRQENSELALPRPAGWVTFAVATRDDRVLHCPTKVPVQVNFRGLAMVTWDCSADDIAGFRISFDGGPTALRIDSLVVVTRDADHAPLQAAVLAAKDITWSSGSLVAPPFVMVSSGTVGFVPIDTGSGLVSSIEVQLLGAWLTAATNG